MNCRKVCYHRKLCEYIFPQFKGEEKDLEDIWECPMAEKCRDLKHDAESARSDWDPECEESD